MNAVTSSQEPDGEESSRRERPTRKTKRPAVLVQAVLGGVIVAAISSAVLCWFGVHQFVGFDSFWHVFIARQETWKAMWREILENAHPPLFYLLLKAAIFSLGQSFLAYRALSIAGIAIATVFVAWSTATITRAALAIIAAAAFGLSASAIDTGLEVRSYGVFLAAAMAATAGWLEWLRSMPRTTPIRSRLLFGFGMSIAVLTHYSAFFVLLAMLATPAVLVVSSARWRIKFRLELARHSRVVAAMFGAPILVAVSVFLVHARHYKNGLGHVVGFMYQPGAESRWTFILRNCRNLLLLFVPTFGQTTVVVTAVWAFLCLGLVVATVRRLPRGRVDAVPLVMFVLLLLSNLAAGLAGRYPFGGNLRHEIFLFPFAILALFAGVEVARRAAPGRWSSRRLWVGTTTAVVVASTGFGLATFPVFPQPRAQIDRFRGDFPDEPTVLVDQFNLIVFFGHYYDWQWHLRWEQVGPPMWQVWEVRHGDNHFAVCRAREWVLDFSRPSTYAQLSDCLARSKTVKVAVFRTQPLGSTPSWDVAETAALAASLAPTARLDVQALDVDGNNIYALFQAAGPHGARGAVDAASKSPQAEGR